MIRKTALICLLIVVLVLSVFPQSEQLGVIGAFRSPQNSLEQRQMNSSRVRSLLKNKYDAKIKVYGQKDFDRINDTLLSLISQGKKNILIDIGKGHFFYKEHHIDLSDIAYPDVAIVIRGHQTVIIPRGRTYIPDKEKGVSCVSSIVDLKKLQPLNLWAEMMWADSLAEVVDPESKLCRIRSKEINGMSLPQNNPANIGLTRWCRCYQYKIDHIENGEVYFFAQDLEFISQFGRNGYNVNYDYLFAGKIPRFRLSSGIIETESYLCEKSNFLSINNSYLRALSLSNIFILGGCQKGQALVALNKARTGLIEVGNCRFVGQKNAVLQCSETDNLYFHDNEVRHNYNNGIISDNASRNTTIVRNYFEDNGEDLSSNRCVICSGENYYIADNTFKNFGYCAICVGQVWHWPKSYLSQGIVERNHIFYDQEHFDNAWKYTIMDSGAIYVWTQNDKAIIRYNFIHDYTGMAQYSAIFCDDGSSNFKIYGNILINTPVFHSIDARRCAGTEKGNNPKSFALKNNIGNEIRDNVLDGTIRFEGHEDKNNGCIKGKNFILRKKDGIETVHKYKSEVRNIEKEEKDIIFEYLGIVDNKVIVSKATWEKMTVSFPYFSKISSFMKKK